MLNWDEIKENGWKPKNDEYLRVLSIDGGGIRGVFPAKYLALIENKTGKKINEYFDLIVGTSTGGIIALALSVGIEAGNIENLYVKNAKSIFKKKLIARIFGKKVGMLLGSLYDNKILTKLLKETFKDYKIIDADTMLCIPSIEHIKAMPKVYKTPHNKLFHMDKDMYMWQVALATSAAPFYFPPACGIDDGCKLDGGLWANNPVNVAIAEAIFHGIPLNKIKVLSIGTGDQMYTASNNIAESSGLVNWRTNIIDLTMNAQSYSADNMAKYLIGNENLIRINFQSPKKLDLDSVEEEKIKILQHEADDMFKKTYRNEDNVESKFFSI
ncbi:CBASS cGAMP-activated phospholipase [Clostridium tyrobutyricum]|uniref:CBASS cGAMP-activated phospholipase n=1 Tax=Clostridium tyrobutyricum TaxID=1519 RepID=UPI0039F680AB